VIVLHLVALVVSSLPDPGELNPVLPRRALDNHTISAAVAPALDRGAAWLRATEPGIVNAVKPLRVLTQPCISVGLRQKWNMFSNPVTADPMRARGPLRRIESITAIRPPVSGTRNARSTGRSGTSRP
jgi:hypothetical protein